MHLMQLIRIPAPLIWPCNIYWAMQFLGVSLISWRHDKRIAIILSRFLNQIKCLPSVLGYSWRPWEHIWLIGVGLPHIFIKFIIFFRRILSSSTNNRIHNLLINGVFVNFFAKNIQIRTFFSEVRLLLAIHGAASATYSAA